MVQRPEIPTVCLPPDQAALRNRSLAETNVWREITFQEVNQTIPDVLASVIAKYPNRLAAKDPYRSFTMLDVDRGANQVASTLLDLIGDRREPVPYLFHIDCRKTVVSHGILRAGKSLVPLDASDTPARLTYMLQDIGARVLLTTKEMIEQARSVAPNGCIVVSLESVLSQRPTSPVLCASQPSDLAAILYTSGSTGQPKGVMNSHRAMLARLRGHVLYDAMGPDQRFTSIGLRLNDLLFPLAGTTNYPFPVREKGMRALAQWIKDCEITGISAVGSGFRQLLNVLPAGESYPSVRLIRTTSEPTARDELVAVREHFPNTIMVHTYSLSEGGWVACYYVDPHAPPAQGQLPVGHIVDDKRVWIMDDEGAQVPQGESGEIVINGLNLADGYWNLPDLTQQAFQDDASTPGWRTYATGDVGRFEPDGSLMHLGRKDLQLKIRGHRVEIGETEAFLQTLPDVKESAVRAWKDAHGDSYLAAYVVADSDSVTQLSLRRTCHAGLPDYLAPSTYTLLEGLPRFSNNKLDRMALPKPERARPKLGNAYVSPSTPLETRLASVWAEVLDLDGVGVEDRFTDLGGHSLAAVRLLAALDEMTGRELPYSVLLDAGTVRELAAVLADGDWAPRWRSLVHVQAGDSRPPLFLVPAAASTSLTLASFAKAMGPQQGVYGFDALGMNGRSEPQRTVEEMAAHYIDEMRQLQPTGPYLIGGRCFGALTAIEMTRQLEADDVEAPLIVVLDSGDLHLSALMPGRSLWRKWHDYGYVNGAALSAIRRNLLFRTRRRYRTVRTRVGRVLDLKAYRQEPGAYVQRVHIQARRRYRPKPVQATMVVYMSQEYAKLGRAEEWRTLAGGEFVIGPSERWAHAGFLDDVENLQQVCPHLRELLRTL